MKETGDIVKKSPEYTARKISKNSGPYNGIRCDILCPFDRTDVTRKTLGFSNRVSVWSLLTNM